MDEVFEAPKVDELGVVEPNDSLENLDGVPFDITDDLISTPLVTSFSDP